MAGKSVINKTHKCNLCPVISVSQNTERFYLSKRKYNKILCYRILFLKCLEDKATCTYIYIAYIYCSTILTLPCDRCWRYNKLSNILFKIH